MSDRLKVLTAEIAELREENERLRDDLSVHQQEGLIVHTYEVETLIAENKRLREAFQRFYNYWEDDMHDGSPLKKAALAALDGVIR